MPATRIAICFLLFSATVPCIAQEAPCGLRTMTEIKAPVYPPIAKAAPRRRRRRHARHLQTQWRGR